MSNRDTIKTSQMKLTRKQMLAAIARASGNVGKLVVWKDPRKVQAQLLVECEKVLREVFIVLDTHPRLLSTDRHALVRKLRALLAKLK